ncbi:MAG TPA: DUF805 domain-containing protein [Gammaproteobacteria bacterium]|nr:DUF805 domain-containing protein [Gammaproteobacteria bacterium]
MGDDSNPYAAPQGRLVAEGGGPYGEVRVFSAEGRLNRLRYLAYVFGLTFLINLVSSAITAALAGMEVPVAAVTIASGIASLWISILLTIQRVHDFSASGWWSALAVIPLVTLIFAIIPGHGEENRFGLEPPPNTFGVYLVATLAIGVPILGIVAAIVIPQLAQG